jgi:hypothetical protein
MDRQSPWNRNMRLAASGFFIVMAGIAFAFVIDYGPHNPLSFLAVAVVATGIGIMFFAVMRGQWWMINALITNRRTRS